MSTVYIWHGSDGSATNEFAVCCPNCEDRLVLHQPDPDLPNRLLATCNDCKAWYLADEKGGSLIPILRHGRRNDRTPIDRPRSD
jgi:hypothetical protein